MKKQYRYVLYIVLILAFVLTASSVQEIPTAEAATYNVNIAADGNDFLPGDGVCETGFGNGECTLRAAIQEANASPGADTIVLIGWYVYFVTWWCR